MGFINPMIARGAGRYIPNIATTDFFPGWMMQNSDRSATKVLIVDDHPVVLSGCRSLFASDNTVKIEEATDAKSGHRAYLVRKPDVTVIDIKLPDVSGFELMRRIRKDDPEARIIIFSMNDDPALVVRAIEMGAQGYVSKGDDPRMLVKAVCGRSPRETTSFHRNWRKRRPFPARRSRQIRRPK